LTRSHAETLRRLLRDSMRPTERDAVGTELASTAASTSPSYAANEWRTSRLARAVTPRR